MSNKQVPKLIDLEQIWIFYPSDQVQHNMDYRLPCTVKIAEGWLAAHKAASDAYWEFNYQLEQLYRKQIGLDYNEAATNEIPHEMIDGTPPA